MRITTAAVIFLFAVTEAVATPGFVLKRNEHDGVSESNHHCPQSLALRITTDHYNHRNAPGPPISADIILSQAA
jgi:hypothetical protein